jgi:alpha-D-ribose 1-methylphosphonate 5-triphosphate diphosphatase
MIREQTLTNARVVTRRGSFLGTVRTLDGAIVEVAPGRTVARGVVDLEGDLLLPGLVELHTEVLEKHLAPRPGVQWPVAAAVLAYDAQLASAGITTVLDSMAVGYLIDGGQRPRNPKPLVEAVRAAQDAGMLRCDHHLHLRCEVSTESVVRDFEPFVKDPALRLVSLMDHAPGQRQFVSVDKYREYNQGRYGFSDAQMDALIGQRLADHARFGGKHRSAITALCQKHGLRLASHDDATTAHVEEAALIGTVIAEFPMTLEAARAVRVWGLGIMAGAPNLIRGTSHSGNVSAAELASRDLLDILSSDYVPAAALHGAWLLHARHGVPLHEAVGTVTAVPAERVGLEDRGEIAPGRRADLVRAALLDEMPVVRSVWRGGQRVA